LAIAKNWKYWLRTLGYPEKERAPRRRPSGLVAMYGSRQSPKQAYVKTLSRTGLYLETADRWPINELISLTLQKDSASGSDFEIDVQGRVASYGEDGVGLEFMLPKGLDPGIWDHLIETADAPTESKDERVIFRMVRAILFLYRLTPSTASEPIHMITGELDESRTRNILEIALAAERMLASQSDAEKMRAHPNVVTDILTNGSWVDDDLTRQLWAGLLISYCNPEGSDKSNPETIELLEQLTANQSRILIESCRRASRESADSTPIVISSEEMVHITGVSDLHRCAADASLLHHHGLLQHNCDFSTYLPKTSFDITPTHFGMQLFELCKGPLVKSA
jgi:hypothetical protein